MSEERRSQFPRSLVVLFQELVWQALKATWTVSGTFWLARDSARVLAQVWLIGGTDSEVRPGS